MSDSSPSPRPLSTASQSNAPQSTLGSRIRDIRARYGWTLKEMSSACGIPVSTLSKIEHDRLTLSYDKLLQFSRRLGMPIAELFAPPGDDGGGPVMARRSVGKLDNAFRVNSPNYDYHYFCPELRRKRMLPILTRVRAHTLGEFGDYVRHAGEEFVYVLEGAIVAHTEFYEPVTLKVGESIYIDSSMGHAFLVAPGFDEALVLGVCSAAEDLSRLAPGSASDG